MSLRTIPKDWTPVEPNVWTDGEGYLVDMRVRKAVLHYKWFDETIMRERCTILTEADKRALTPSGVRVLRVLGKLRDSHGEVRVQLRVIAEQSCVNVRTLPAILRRLQKFGCVALRYDRRMYFKAKTDKFAYGTTCIIKVLASAWVHGRDNAKTTIKVSELGFMTGMVDYAPQGGRRKGAGRRPKTALEPVIKTRVVDPKPACSAIQHQVVSNQNAFFNYYPTSTTILELLYLKKDGTEAVPAFNLLNNFSFGSGL